MSFTNSLKSKSEIGEPEIESSVKHDDVKKKFTLYRSNAELIDTKYKEAKIVIDRLKEEIQVSREMEKSHRERISCLQNRLSALEEKGKKLCELSEKQRKNTEEIRNIDSNIICLSTLVHEMKQKFQSIICSTVKEIDIIRENRELRCAVEAKETELHLLKTELQSGISDKEELIKKYVTENKELKTEIEISKSEASDIKHYYDQIVNTYKQEILEYKRIIKEMENERNSILGDYDIGNTPQDKSNSKLTGNPHNDKGYSCPDSTVRCLTDERENRTQQLMDVDLTLVKRDGCTGPRLLLPSSQKTSQENRATCHFSKFGFKKKAKLDFLYPVSEPSEAHAKNRLYSQNSDHYINQE